MRTLLAGLLAWVLLVAVGVWAGESVFDQGGPIQTFTGAVSFPSSVTLSGGSANSFLYLNGSKAITSVVPTNGQIFIGSTGIAPVVTTLTPTANQTTITNGAGTITVGLASTVSLTGPAITPGSGTGVTVNNTGALQRQIYKVTVDFTALSAAALTADKTIATLPAKTRLVGIVADTTTKYVGGTVSAATLIVGKTVGGNEYIVSHDVFTNPVTKGLADVDLGTSINRANAVQGGDLPSWTTTTIISVRLTTVTANTNALTQGSTTYYLITEVHP